VCVKTLPLDGRWCSKHHFAGCKLWVGKCQGDSGHPRHQSGILEFQRFNMSHTTA